MALSLYYITKRDIMEEKITSIIKRFYGEDAKLIETKHGYSLTRSNMNGFAEYLVHKVKETKKGLILDQVACSENLVEMKQVLDEATTAYAVLRGKDALWIDAVLRNGVTFNGETEKKFREEGCLIMLYPDAMALIDANETKKYRTDWEEITEDSYDYSFEALPPARYSKYGEAEYFMLGECYSGNIYYHYIAYKGKFFRAKRRTSDSVTDMVEEVMGLLA